MKKGSNVVIVVVILAVVVAGVALAITRNKNSKSATKATATTATQTSTDTSDSTLVKNVTIENYSFNPKTVTVKVGGTVTWTNHDDMNHTVTADDSVTGGLNSILLSKGATYSYIFNKPGTYTYHCQVHPSLMTGTVVVTN